VEKSDITASVVAALIHDQFPQWAHLPVVPVALDGWDNTMFRLGDDIAVHTGARVSALARPGEVLVSRTVVDLVAGSGIAFTARGEHELKGVPGSWQLFAVDT
jgi:hypothetical protein